MLTADQTDIGQKRPDQLYSYSGADEQPGGSLYVWNPACLCSSAQKVRIEMIEGLSARPYDQWAKLIAQTL
jgi:hypothetical protein